MVERFDLVQYEHFDQLDRAVNGDWVRYSDHEAELSALKKQVEELTAERDALEVKAVSLLWAVPGETLCGEVQSLHKRALELQSAEAEAEAAALRKALEFYADVSKYPAPLTGGMGDLWADCGQIARAALDAAGGRR